MVKLPAFEALLRIERVPDAKGRLAALGRPLGLQPVLHRTREDEVLGLESTYHWPYGR